MPVRVTQLRGGAKGSMGSAFSFRFISNMYARCHSSRRLSRKLLESFREAGVAEGSDKRHARDARDARVARWQINPVVASSAKTCPGIRVLRNGEVSSWSRGHSNER